MEDKGLGRGLLVEAVNRQHLEHFPPTMIITAMKICLSQTAAHLTVTNISFRPLGGSGGGGCETLNILPVAVAVAVQF